MELTIDNLHLNDTAGQTMISSTLGALGKLSAELRVEIFSYVVQAEHQLRRVQRNEKRSDVTSLLLANKQIYQESAELLYRLNVFLLSQRDIKEFSNANDFCHIQHIALRRESIIGPDDDHHDHAVGLLRLGPRLVAKCKVLAARTPENKLDLKDLTISTNDIVPLVMQSPNSAGPWVYEPIDIGEWHLVSPGLTSNLRLVHGDLRDLWQRIQRSKQRSLMKVAMLCVLDVIVAHDDFNFSMLLGATLAADLGHQMKEDQYAKVLPWSKSMGMNIARDRIMKYAKAPNDESILKTGPHSTKEALWLANTVLLGALDYAERFEYERSIYSSAAGLRSAESLTLFR